MSARPPALRLLALALAGTALSLAACSDDEGNGPVLCTEEARPGIVVEVFNAQTGLPAAQGATLTVQEGEFIQETQAFSGSNFLAGAIEREGVYRVTVTKPGFDPWVREEVEVGLTPDGCHVETVFLEARLEPIEVGEGA